jgi:hypothetical protein
MEEVVRVDTVELAHFLSFKIVAGGVAMTANRRGD